ncbi:Glucose-6-phosphatase like protein [Argiope bruennichi]|uniref:Glucose-6-phosphatase n=1 Tax=Argiope bruennichi TaxID=94029 RepID=A0A8T0E2Z9_ARGBR|nr:Glucose-6-phosphatase like protein [Argiope bruennichi]
MEGIYQIDVTIIEVFQSWFLEYEKVFIAISNIFDPRYAFLLYAPIVFSVDWYIGRKLMWVVVAVEWINHLLKWLLHGERPYWWVHEADVYNGRGIPVPNIYQFSLTCETGPGSPSGHSQSCAAVWYVIFDSFLEKYGSVVQKDDRISKLCWAIYFALLATVGTSRIFIAAHFPHQCLFGMFLGWLVATRLKNINQKHFSIFQYCVFTLGMFASAFLVFEFLEVIGADPMWTIERAVKWCNNPDNVHLDTTPLYAMMRYCGFMFGMGFGFNSYSFNTFSKENFTTPMKICCALLSVAVCLLSETITFSKENMAFFYFQAFALNAFLSYVMISVIPNMVFQVSKLKEKDS